MRFDSRRFLALSLSFGLAAAVLTSPLSAQNSEVVAKVDGSEITEADVALAMKDFGSALGNMPEAQKRDAVIGLLIDTKLIARAAEEKKLDQSEEYKRTLAYLRDKALMDSYLTDSAKTAVSDADVQKVYDETVKTVKPEEEVRARHILFRAEDEAAFAEAEKKAQDVAKKLKDGGDFEALAKELSEDPGSKENGGDLGYFTKETMVPEFADVAFKLEKGAVSEPVKTQFGWHVIKAEDKRPQPVPTLEQVKDQIVVYLERKAQQDTIKALRDKAKIERIGAPEAKPEPEAPAAPEKKN